MLLCPILLLLGFVLLKKIQVSSILSIIKRFAMLWVLPIPILGMLLRIIYSNINPLSLVPYIIFQILTLVIIPLVLYLYIYVCIVLPDLKKIKTGQDNTLLLHINDNIIAIACINECIIVVLKVLLNNIFLSWIDVLVLPWLNIAMIPIIIMLASYGTEYYLDKTVTSVRIIYSSIVVCIVSVLVVVVPLLYINLLYVYGYICSGIIILVGFICMGTTRDVRITIQHTKDSDNNAVLSK